MATTEDVSSQEFHETADGATLLRKFSSTFDDYNTGAAFESPFFSRYGSVSFPYRIGDALSYDSNFGTFSTERFNIVRKAEPDTNASWSENFSMQSSPTEDDFYYEDSASGNVIDRFVTRVENKGPKIDWEDKWASAGNSVSKKPENIIYEPTWIFTTTVYSTKLWQNLIATYYLSVNSDDLIGIYFSQLASRTGNPAGGGAGPGLNETDWGKTDQELYGGGTERLNDIGRWLFTACEINRARFDSWQYDLTFTYNLRWKWNEPYGIPIDKYPGKAFFTLFEVFTGPPRKSSLGGNRS